MSRKRTPKKKPRAEVSKYNPMPIYRAYGHTKKEYWLWEEFLAFIQKTVAVCFLLLIFFVIFLCFASWFLFGGLLVRTGMVLTISISFCIVSTKVIRKRISLKRNLKKLCLENKFDLRYERSFFKSLFWSSDKIDFTLETSDRVYYVKLLAVMPYRCRLYLDSSTELKTVKMPLLLFGNKLAVIFDLKPKIKKRSIDFTEARQYSNKKTVKSIIVNPVCDEIYYKLADRSYSQTGNGGHHFGFSIFTASGFINYVKRAEGSAVS